MVKSKKLLMLFLSMLLLSVLIGFIPTRPFVIVKNDTDKQMYLYSSEGVHGLEPTPDEVRKIIRQKPNIIEPGETIKLTLSFMSLIKENAEFNIGWRIGGQYEYNSMGGGSQAFILSSLIGGCSILLTVHDGVHNYTLRNEPDKFCYKKITPLRYKNDSRY
ncbi:hypothetical protein C9426_33745 [Serratia sp. S1B]|nr:hypothetical protein C9426_33745 [Serratia sp. S1B]